MRAVVADHAGTPDVLRAVTLSDPEPHAGQARVAVEVAAVTFVDTLIRAGSPIAPPARFPVVLGNGIGGTIDRIGPGVDPALIGTRVVTTTGGTGGYASLVVVATDSLHRVPDRLTVGEASALLADGRTAIGLHQAAGIQPGETVVVTAAAGGVGSILVQLANASGARVIALVGSRAKVDYASALGADVIVNYRDPDWTSRIREAADDGIDVVFDGVGADITSVLFPLVRSGGRYVSHGAAGGRWGVIDETAAAGRGVGLIGLSAVGASDMYDLTERALDLAAHGIIRPTIGQTFPLDRAADAHAAIESRRTIGKTLLLP
ncbi:MAG: alcohol dehydrogenase [Actinomycetota bacterium]|nr:MAG: alcohol dehydrogenase [Actinomycetota bacterium]